MPRVSERELQEFRRPVLPGVGRRIKPVSERERLFSRSGRSSSEFDESFPREAVHTVTSEEDF